jgi:hypothetical protein
MKISDFRNLILYSQRLSNRALNNSGKARSLYPSIPLMGLFPAFASRHGYVIHWFMPDAITKNRFHTDLPLYSYKSSLQLQ